jgi:hypothetical protein
MQPRTARALAAGLDAVCLALFVALGRASHDPASGLTWYLTVLWPFLVGWFVVALPLQLYMAHHNSWRILATTWVVGCAIALVLRGAVTHRPTPVIFILVTYSFIGIVTFGWRLFLRGLETVRSHE